LPHLSLARLSGIAVTVALAAPALGQGVGIGGPTPLAIDLRKVPVGSWAEYTIAIGGAEATPVTSRWALVARNEAGNTLEVAMEGKPLQPMGGSVVLRLGLAPDPVGAEKPIKQIVMQIGGRAPMEMPLDMPGLPSQRFHRPDPGKIVGKESLKVPAGTFKTTHYRDVNATATVDTWISDEVPPLGVVRVKTVPRPGAAGPGGQPVPAVSMELARRGKDAKTAMTAPVKPFDPSAFGGPAPAKK
jgi:hypothetical protein